MELTLGTLSADSECCRNLSREVEGIKATLEQPSDEEDDEAAGREGPSPESHQGSHSSLSYSMSPPMVLGTTQATGSLSHPPPARMKTLCEIYFRSVDPLMKILHKPTTEKAFELHMVNPVDHPLSRTTEALFFAMYFAVRTLLPPPPETPVFWLPQHLCTQKFRICTRWLTRCRL